jgi:hypothetical protein
MRTPEVLVIGDANPDLVLGGDVEPKFGQVEKLVDSAELVLGGSGAIVAVGLARLGVPTALAATVGDDLFGRFVRDELAASGVDAPSRCLLRPWRPLTPPARAIRSTPASSARCSTALKIGSVWNARFCAAACPPVDSVERRHRRHPPICRRKRECRRWTDVA